MKAVTWTNPSLSAVAALVLLLGACTDSNPAAVVPDALSAGDQALDRGMSQADVAFGADLAPHDGLIEADGKPAADQGTPDGKPAVDQAVGVDGGGKVCGGLIGQLCPKSQVCNITTCAADAQGVCVPAAQSCPTIYDPVCGCDNKTYGNDCVRLKAGVALSHVGVCTKADAGVVPDAGRLCGHVNPPCPKGDVCDLHSCAKAAVGSCVTQPAVCEKLYDPVCGCDNKTYGNDCLRLVAGVALRSVGACP